MLKSLVITFLVVGILSSCNQAKDQNKEKYQNKQEVVKAPDSSTQFFDQGTIKLIDHYVSEFDKWKDKQKIAMAYKLYKALSVYKNLDSNIALLSNSKKVEEIMSYHEKFLDRALKLEAKLSKNDRLDIFSQHEQSLLKLLDGGVLHRDIECSKSFDKGFGLDIAKAYKYKAPLYNFFYQSDVHFVGNYIDKILKHVNDKKLKMYYENIQKYYPKKNLELSKSKYSKMVTSFNKQTQNSFKLGDLKSFFKKYGECFWGNSKLFSNMIVTELTHVRAKWIIQNIQDKRLNFKDGELVSFAFSRKSFPYDKPLDGWNRFFTFKKKDGNTYIVSKGVEEDDPSDDIEISL